MIELTDDEVLELKQMVQERRTKARFKPPTLEEVRRLFAERGVGGNECEKFFNHYESNGWRVGKNKMKSVSASIAGWVSRSKDFTITKTGYKPPETNTNLPAYKPYVDKTRDVKREPMPQDIKALVGSLTDSITIQ